MTMQEIETEINITKHDIKWYLQSNGNGIISHKDYQNRKDRLIQLEILKELKIKNGEKL